MGALLAAQVHLSDRNQPSLGFRPRSYAFVSQYLSRRVAFGSMDLDFGNPQPLVLKTYDVPDLPCENIAGRLD